MDHYCAIAELQNEQEELEVNLLSDIFDQQSRQIFEQCKELVEEECSCMKCLKCLQALIHKAGVNPTAYQPSPTKVRENSTSNPSKVRESSNSLRSNPSNPSQPKTTSNH